jgi:predicted N-acetyltransferase YhbS
VRRLYLSAFSDVEREAVAGLAVNLLAETTTPATFALVAETDDNLVGHVGFSPRYAATDPASVERRLTG